MFTSNFYAAKRLTCGLLSAALLMVGCALPARAAEKQYLLRETRQGIFDDSTCTYHYDAQGRLISKRTDTDALRVSYYYDAQGKLACQQGQVNQEAQGETDALKGFFTREYRPDGTVKSLSFQEGDDRYSRLLHMTYDEGGEVSNSWQVLIKAGEMPLECLEESRYFYENTYDARGRITKQIMSHRLDSEAMKQDEVTLWEYAPDGSSQKDHTVYAEGSASGAVLRHEAFSYDKEGRLLTWVCDRDNALKTDCSKTYTYDDKGNPTALQEAEVNASGTGEARELTYKNTYDGEGRLTRIDRTETSRRKTAGKLGEPQNLPGYTETFTYDAQGNLTCHTMGQEKILYTYGPLPGTK